MAIAGALRSGAGLVFGYLPRFARQAAAAKFYGPVLLQPAKLFPLKWDANIAWFQTDDYASRISLYEKGLLYGFSIPSFYGKGERFALNIRYELSKYLIFQAKYGMTHYRDRKTIGSGLEQINGNVKNDLYLQVRLKF